MQIKEIELSNYTSIKIGHKTKVLVVKNTLKKGYYIIGGANNIIIDNEHPPLAILSDEYDYIYIKDNLLHIGATTKSNKIISFCKKNNIGGLEFLDKIPGTLGGILFMNAGLKEFEIFNNLNEILFNKKIKKKEEIQYSYRKTNIKELILGATFKINNKFDFNLLEKFKKLRKNQPNKASAGSCFKNPKGYFAGKLIEKVGLKGFIKGSMSFSKEHANFLVNLGGGKFEEAIYLIQEAERRVYEKFNIKLSRENKIVSKHYYKKGYEL